MGTIAKNDLEKLYSSGKSMWEIGQTLKCSLHKVKYWINKYEIPKRTRSQAMYAKLNPHGDPFLLKSHFTSKEIYLFGLGVGIYWGEGNKSDIYQVRVTNTDPEIIKTFRDFLLQICQVNQNKLGYSIICFNDSSPDASLEHWSSELEIPGEKFGKIVQIPSQGKGNYKKKSQYGVCSITFSNIKLKAWIMQQIKNKRPGSSTAERIHGKDQTRVRLSIRAHI